MRRRNSGSVIFLTELLLSLTIFALCAAVCVSLFALSHGFSEQGSRLSRAVVATQSCAEAFKKYPDTADLARILRGSAGSDNCVVYYDNNWSATTASDAMYVLRIDVREEGDLRRAKVNASVIDGTLIYSLNVSALSSEDSI